MLQNCLDSFCLFQFVLYSRSDQICSSENHQYTGKNIMYKGCETLCRWSTFSSDVRWVSFTITDPHDLGFAEEDASLFSTEISTSCCSARGCALLWSTVVMLQMVAQWGVLACSVMKLRQISSEPYQLLLVFILPHSCIVLLLCKLFKPLLKPSSPWEENGQVCHWGGTLFKLLTCTL